MEPAPDDAAARPVDFLSPKVAFAISRSRLVRTSDDGPSDPACGRLEVDGRLYLARAAPSRGLATAGNVGRSGVVLCGNRRIAARDLVGVAGVHPAAAVVRRGSPGVRYVAVGVCPRSARAVALLACLQNQSRP